MKQIQRWFNLAPFPDAEYITDRYGRKCWIDWATHFDLGPKLVIYYRRTWVGTVEYSWVDDDGIVINDIIIFNYKYNLRGRGLGKSMMKCYVAEMRRRGVKYIRGFIKPHEGSTKEYLIEWYRRQGFEVFEPKPGRFHVRLELNNE